MTFRTLIAVLILLTSCADKKSETTEESTSQKEADKPAAALSEQKATEPKASFKTFSLLSGKVQIEMPEQLEPMDAEMFRLKYPVENAETTKAYSNEDGTVSLLISPRQEKATQADLPKYQQMLRESFGKNPSVDFKKSEIKKINGRDFIVIEMITPAVDTKVYNQMFVTCANGSLLMGTFNCTINLVNEWQRKAVQIISSVKVKD